MKMNRFITLLSFLLIFLPNTIHAQQYRWVKGGGSGCAGGNYDDLEKVTNLCADANRNVYAVASLGDLNINVDTFSRTHGYFSSACDRNVLFASYNCNGQLRFAKFIDAYGTAKAFDMAYDGAGSIYIAGYVESGFKKYFGSDTTVNSINYNSFLIKYDTSGKMKWLRFLGIDAVSNQNVGMGGAGLAFDGQGNLHMIATISSGIQLNSTLTSRTGTYDLVYSALGALTSATRLPIDTNSLVTKAIFNKQSNALYTRIESYNYTAYPNTAICCLKNGLMAWEDSTGAKLGLGLGGFDYKAGNAIYVILDGAINVSFSFGGLSGTNTTYPSQRYSTIIRLDTNGVGKWFYKLDGSSGINQLYQVSVLPDGSAAAIGQLGQKIRHGNDSLVAPAAESINPFMLLVDSSGSLVKLDQMHGGGYTDGGVSITSDNGGNIYLGGYFETTMTATGLGTGISSTGGSADFWLMKYGYPCNCTTPAANYITGTASGKTVSYTYNGTTTSIDSLVWNFGDGQKQKVTMGFTTPVSHTFTTNGRYNVCVTAYGSCGVNTYCKQTPLSIGGLAALGAIKVYPNPASNYITIEGAQGASGIILNSIGQRAMSFSINTDRQIMDIASLPSGMYVLQITDDKGNRGSMSVVKQ